MAYLADTPVILNNNGFLFKNNIEYVQAKILQDRKMIKKLIEIFFNNLDLSSMQNYLYYKNMDK